MRFLVDECTGPKVADWLRSQNFEVFSIFEEARGIKDDLIIKKAKATGDNEVDGITGATLSCKAFELLLNSEIKRFVAIMKENK